MMSTVAIYLLILSSAIVAKTDSIQFVTQILEPTGGKISKPVDWFYQESHGGPVYRWLISKEDPATGKPYQTGMRIQLFANLKKNTNKTAKQFVLDFINSKRATENIVSTCNEQDQGLFTRICLETIEGQYHIMYSGFWGTSGMDIAVVTVSGSPIELWKQSSPIFQRMSQFELIDMERFSKPNDSSKGLNKPISEREAIDHQSTVTYFPKDGVGKDTGRIEVRTVRLLSTEEIIAANITTEKLVSLIKQVEAIVFEEFQHANANGLIVYKLALNKKSALNIEIRQQGEFDNTNLQTTYDKIKQLDYKSNSKEISFEIEFKIRPK